MINAELDNRHVWFAVNRLSLSVTKQMIIYDVWKSQFHYTYFY